MESQMLEFAFRPDAAHIRTIRGEVREPARLQAHYMVERELARKLLGFPSDSRASRYSEIYQELFARVEDHPQHSGVKADRPERVLQQVRFLDSFVNHASRFVEIGCGDAGVALAMAQKVAVSVGVDVTDELVAFDRAPANFSFVKTDGISLKIEGNSVDLVYSNQLMEHLHPDDALRQLKEISRILAPKGRYICVTPNRLTGPHDISCYFSYEPQGLHLREYDHGALAALFRTAGFCRIRSLLRAKGRMFQVPVAPVRLAERTISALPRSVQLRITQMSAIQTLAGVTMIATKEQ